MSAWFKKNKAIFILMGIVFVALALLLVPAYTRTAHDLIVAEHPFRRILPPFPAVEDASARKSRKERHFLIPSSSLKKPRKSPLPFPKQRKLL